MRKFIKKHKSIILIALLLAVLVTVYFFVRNNGKDEENVKENVETKSTSIKILEFDRNKVKELKILTEDGKFIFSMQGNTLLPSYPKDMRIIVYQGEIIVSELVQLKAESVVEENAANLDQYGLKNPETISVLMQDGTTYSVEVGNQTPSGNGIYLKLKGENRVYNVNSETGSILKVSKASLWDYRLYNLRAEDITGLTLEKDNEIVFSADKDSEAKWVIKFPVVAEAKIEKISEIIDNIKAPSASELVETNPKNLNKYGLDNPQYSFQVETSAGKAKILFGNEKIKGASIYAKLSNFNEVFTISEKYINFTDTPIQDVLNPYIYTPFIYDISKIVVSMDGKTTTSEIVADSQSSIDDVKYSVNGKSALVKDKDGNLYFEKYYSALIGINTSRIDLSAKPSGNQEATITYYHKKSNKAMKIGFVSKDKNNYYIFKNNKYSSFIIEKTKLNEIRNAYETMMKEIK